MALPDHFEGEDVIITFEKEESYVVYNVEGKVLSWNQSGGSESTEDVYAFGNKTFNFQKPRDKFTLSMEIMINDSDFDFVHLGAYASTDNMQTTNKLLMSDGSPGRWRVIFWFQDSASHSANAARTIIVPSKSVSMYRIICVDVKAVTFDKEFSADDYLKGTLSLEFSATDENANPNFIEQEGIASGTTATVLADMTTTAADDGGNTGLLVKARGYLEWNATTPAWTAGTTATGYRYTG